MSRRVVADAQLSRERLDPVVKLENRPWGRSDGGDEGR